LKVVLFGATGMVGGAALLECLDDARVTAVLSVSRRSCGVRHPKLTEALADDLFRLDAVRPELAGADACFFCLGVSAVGLSEASYTRMTHDLTLSVARDLLAAGARPVFCYVSGAGTDSTGRGRSMWARVKGRTENDLLAMPFRAAYMFRPGFIQPLRGVRSRTPLYQAFYTVLAPLASVLPRLLPGLATTSVALGRAMIRVAAEGYPRPILESRDINAIGAAA
jgi:uncharacterized protein YbjT (DUF2867 family)